MGQQTLYAVSTNPSLVKPGYQPKNLSRPGAMTTRMAAPQYDPKGDLKFSPQFQNDRQNVYNSISKLKTQIADLNLRNPQNDNYGNRPFSAKLPPSLPDQKYGQILRTDPVPSFSNAPPAYIEDLKFIRKAPHLYFNYNRSFDHQNLQINDILSDIQIFQVVNIDYNVITVTNGKNLQVISKNQLRKMYSADHYETEHTMTMTELAELMTKTDQIFKVKFRKQLDEKVVLKQLQNNEQINGQLREITGTLIENDEKFGRSLIYDLNANMVKQVDHRTIESLIYKNVKYILGKKSEQKPISVAWNMNKLTIGNWFGATNYYKVAEIQGDQVKFTDETVVDIEIAESMCSSQLFEETEKVNRTRLIEIFTSAGKSVMTISFRKKAEIREILLMDISQEEKAKLISRGQPRVMQCHLTGSEPIMGRSQVVDLNAGIRLVDHRTIDSVILNNKRYIVS